MPKHFCNGPDAVVADALHGLVQTTPNLALLDIPNTGIVVRADWNRDTDGQHRVALISGGGSGHEPAHVGLVGKGMLTAAVAGDVFSSPSTSAVLAAILAVTGSAGCVVIVKNYTGDRLNFGLAVEQARIRGLRCAMVIVGDDVALTTDRQRARGVAGTALVHKVAGAAAEAGLGLDEVARAAQDAAKSIYTISASLGTCSLYNQAASQRLADDTLYELGLGIHGEPGARTLPMEDARGIVSRMAGALRAALPSHAAHSEWCLLVNNLGGVPQIEMSLVAGLATQAVAAELGIRATVAIVGSLVTALNMYGFSITLLELNDSRRSALFQPCEAVGWVPPHAMPRAVRRVPGPPAETAESTMSSAGRLDPAVSKCIKAAMSALIALEPKLNEWDATCGDGDAGSSFGKGARSILADCSEYPADPAQMCLAMARSVQSMGGTSGALVQIALTSAARAVRETQAVGMEACMVGLKAGCEAIMELGGAKPGDRTMVDALAPACNAATLAGAATAARQGAQSTCAMAHARLGRSSYLQSSDLSGTPDPGAEAVACVLEALSQHWP